MEIQITKSQKQITLRATTAEDIEMLYVMSFWASERLKELQPKDPMLKIYMHSPPINVKDFDYYLSCLINECRSKL